MRRTLLALLLASSAAFAGNGNEVPLILSNHDQSAWSKSFCGTQIWAGMQAARTTGMNGGFSGGASYAVEVAEEACAVAYLEGGWLRATPRLAPVSAGLGFRIGHPAQLTLQAGYTGVSYSDIGYRSALTTGMSVNFLMPSLPGAGIRVAFNYTFVDERKRTFWAMQGGVSYQF